MKRKGYSDAERAADYKVVFGSPTGQRVLTDILHKGNVFAAIEAPDTVVAARMEGARHLALHIASFIRFDAAEFNKTWQAPKDAG